MCKFESIKLQQQHTIRIPFTLYHKVYTPTGDHDWRVRESRLERGFFCQLKIELTRFMNSMLIIHHRERKGTTERETSPAITVRSAGF